MDAVYDNTEKQCKNIFISEQSRMRENFTKLWTQVICEKEEGLTTKK